jgi:hypothetical protein
MKVPTPDHADVARRCASCNARRPAAVG